MQKTKKMLKVFAVAALCPAAALFLDAPSAFAMAKRPPHESLELPQTSIAPLPPLTLEDCFQLALGRSEELARREANIEQTWADFLSVSGEVIGDARFEMLHFRQEPQGTAGDTGATATATRGERRTRQFVITQPLFRGFRALGALRGAGSLREQRLYEKQRAEQLLFLDVALAFYGSLQLQKDLSTQEEIIRLLDDRAGELMQREKIGKSRISEVVSARARLKTAQANRARIQGLWAIQKRFLEFLTGISMMKRELVEEQLPLEPLLPLDAYLDRSESRPDVKAAEQALKTAQQRIIVAQSGLWPEIALENHLYEKREGFQSGIDWDLLLSIDVPLFTGGSTLGEIKSALVARKKAKLDYSETYRRARLQIKQAYEAWLASGEEFKALEEAVEAAKENYRVQKEEYEYNLVNNLDVLDALENVNDTEIAMVRSYYDQKMNHWRLQIASGACCESR